MNTQNALQLELHVPDFELAKQFYRLLGFEVVWERVPEADKGYLILKNDGGCILNFWPGTDVLYQQAYFQNFDKATKRGYGVEVVITTNLNLEALQQKLTQNGVKVVEPLIKRPWGLYDFRIEDPFGYYLRITTPHDITQSNNAVE